jgi:HSP20 family molecular chaperone IbpA
MSNTAIEKRENRANTPERIEQASLYTPLVDIVETSDAFIFHADVPGVRSGDMDISFENGVLSIHGKVEPRQPHDQNYLWREYGVGNFYRQFTLNTSVNVDQIKAELKNGELKLTVPKAESAKTKKIQVKTS